MSHLLSRFSWRLTMAILLSVTTLSIGLCWTGLSKPSWAAPEQNPDLQTIPTRPLEETPELPGSAPPGVEMPTRQKADNDESDDDSDQSLPAPTPTQKDNQADNNLPAVFPQGTTEIQQDQPSAQKTSPKQSNVDEAETLAKEDAGPQILSTPIAMPQTEPVAIQPTGHQIAAFSTPGSSIEALPNRGGSLLWLYALALGIILMVGGVALVKRA